jgi:hypothetical protein
MKIGLFGLPNSGKTTVFNALTKSEAPVTAYAGTKVEPNIAVVDVGDERVKRLSAMYKPRKTVFATIEVVDFVGLRSGSAREEPVAGETVQLARTMDALALVVRNFPDETGAAPRPVEDLRALEEELLLGDLVVVEKRLERIRDSRKKGVPTAGQQAEERALEKIAAQLNQEKPVRELEFSVEEMRAIRGFGFLTQKPVIVVINSHETTFGKNAELIEQLSPGRRVVEFAGSFEMELSRLGDEEAEVFMQDMGIQESARERLTRAAYLALGYISFFTVGEDEVRAWNIRAGDNAVEAAGVIHSDLARGFIRAECFGCEDVFELGSEKAVKEKGRLRLEGKDYVVRDGDILNIRYNV